MVVFSEEGAAGATELPVVGPVGKRVDQGNPALDLHDMARQPVTVGLHPGIGLGTSIVSWHSASVEDGDTHQASSKFNAGSAAVSVSLRTLAPNASQGSIPAALPFSTAS